MVCVDCVGGKLQEAVKGITIKKVQHVLEAAVEWMDALFLELELNKEALFWLGHLMGLLTGEQERICQAV